MNASPMRRHMGDAFIFQDDAQILHAFYCAAVVGINRL